MISPLELRIKVLEKAAQRGLGGHDRVALGDLLDQHGATLCEAINELGGEPGAASPEPALPAPPSPLPAPSSTPDHGAASD